MMMHHLVGGAKVAVFGINWLCLCTTLDPTGLFFEPVFIRLGKTIALTCNKYKSQLTSSSCTRNNAEGRTSGAVEPGPGQPSYAS